MISDTLDTKGGFFIATDALCIHKHIRIKTVSQTGELKNIIIAFWSEL
jgi:hypothetical protein